jgi:hypothetical protein
LPRFEPAASRIQVYSVASAVTGSEIKYYCIKREEESMDLREIKTEILRGTLGRAIREAVSRWLPVKGHEGFVVDKVAMARVFSYYFGFPCQSFHLLLHTSSSSIIRD